MKASEILTGGLIAGIFSLVTAAATSGEPKKVIPQQPATSVPLAKTGTLPAFLQHDKGLYQEYPKPTGTLGNHYVSAMIGHYDAIIIWAKRNNCTEDGYKVQAHGPDVEFVYSRKVLTMADAEEIKQAWIKASGVHTDSFLAHAFSMADHNDVEVFLKSGTDPFNIRELMTDLINEKIRNFGNVDGLTSMRELQRRYPYTGLRNPTEADIMGFFDLVEQKMGKEVREHYQYRDLPGAPQTNIREVRTMTISDTPSPECRK